MDGKNKFLNICMYIYIYVRKEKLENLNYFFKFGQNKYEEEDIDFISESMFSIPGAFATFKIKAI